MQFPIVVASLFGLAFASPLTDKRASKPAAFFLAGDSTTAAPSGSGGGWGNGFLSLLVNGAIGTNYGHNGATTVSFVKGGDWANVLKAVTSKKSTYDTYVTIQFGHNDQKAAAGISIANFTTNLSNMVSDVRSAGGTPILVTSLSRRNFDSSGKIKEDLAPQVAATISVGTKTTTTVLHLNEESTKYLNAIGKTDAWKYNRVSDDYTHLNLEGQAVFGQMVGYLLSESNLAGNTGNYVKLNQTIVGDITKGVFILP